MHQLLNSLKLIKDSLESKGANPDYIRVAIKEELQNYILAAIYNNPETDSLIFIGGTCLRKLFGLNRLSEDLDFDNPGGVALELIGVKITDFFKKLEFNKIDYAIQKSDQVSRLTLRFSILYDLGLSPHESEKLHVKVETASGTGGPAVSPIIQTPFSHDNLAILIKHYLLETMMAGKISACINRVWKKGATGITVKGRDYYDLIWYMQKQISPDLEKLKIEGVGNDFITVFKKLDDKVSKIKPQDLYIDLKSYFESDKFIKDWCGTFPELYKRYRSNYIKS
jgi:predicted nucleotidyltransferase component of viral defense system